MWGLLVCPGDKKKSLRDSVGCLDNITSAKPTIYGTYKYQYVRYLNRSHHSQHGRSDSLARAILHSHRRMQRAARCRIPLGAH